MIHELADGFWCCEQLNGSRIIRQVVCAGDHSVLVVDTGLASDAASDILELLTRLGDRALTVLITHPDADHVGGTAALVASRPAAKILAGPADIELVGDPERTIAERYSQFSRTDDVPFGKQDRIRSLVRAGAPFTAEPAMAESVIDLGGCRAEFVSASGHSPGHTVAWFSKQRLLAAGDAVMGFGIRTVDGALLIPPIYAPPSVYLATVARLRFLSVGTLVTGHDPVHVGADVDLFLEESRLASVRLAALTEAAIGRRSQTLLEICQRVHDAYDGLPEGRAADLAPTVDGHLFELVEAGTVECAGGPPRQFKSVT